MLKRQLWSSLATGAVLGVTEVALATSFAALVFSGRLGSRLPSGIGLMLFTTAVAATVVTIGSSLAGTIGMAQDSPAAVVALMAAAVAARLPLGSEEAFLTVVGLLALTTLVTGVLFLVVGTFRIGGLVRFIPYPVMGGFLAGTGWLLVKGGLAIPSKVPLSLSTLSDFMSWNVAAHWLPALAFAVVVTVAARRWNPPFLVPGAVAVGFVLFYAVLGIGGWSVHRARAEGWLMGSIPSGQLWHPWTWSALSGAHWSTVFSQGTTLPTLLVVALIALLLNVSGIELSLRQDTDVNRELRVAGVANLASGLGGGSVGYQSLIATLLAHRTGAGSRLVGAIVAVSCGLAALGGASVVALLPKPLLGGIIIFFALGLLWEWIVDAFKSLPLGDYLIVLLILGVVAFKGFLTGVSVGIVAAVVLFVVNYSRTEVVKHALSAASYRSRVDRPARQQDYLRAHGEEIFVLELQGYVFFGTAHGLLNRISERALADDGLSPLRFVIVDFRQVSGLDSSAALSFERAKQLAGKESFTVVLTGLSDQVRRLLRHTLLHEDSALRVFPDLDRGLEWCEDELLHGGPPGVEAEEDFWSQLARRLDGVQPDRLLDHLERIELPRNQHFIHQGDESDDLYFLASGRVTVTLEHTSAGRRNGERPGDGDEGHRLRTMGPGSVIGEVSMYAGTPRTSSVITETACTLYRLSRAELQELAATDPSAAAALHRMFASLLAERLADTLHTIDDLLT